MDMTDLLEGSFRGATFLLCRGDKSYGRKAVSHEYPNVDYRDVEDMGLDDDKFALTITVGSNNYIADRNALENALKQPGPGQLIHPFYGPITVQVIKVVQNEDTNKLGDIEIKVDFEKTRVLASTPVGIVAGAAALLAAGQTLDTSTVTWIGDAYEVSNGFPRNFLDGVSQFQDLSSSLTSIVSSFTTSSALTPFTSLLGTFTSSINSLISTPLALGQSIVDLFSSYQTLQTDPVVQLQMNQAVFSYGNDDQLPPPTTAERIERIKNRNVVNTAIQSTALSNSYEAAANITFIDTAQLDQVRTSLDAQFEAVSNLPELSPDVLDQLQSMKNTIRNVFNNVEVNLFRISIIETPPLPVSIIAFMYYGDTDLVDELISINDIQYPAQVGGELQLFVK